MSRFTLAASLFVFTLVAANLQAAENTKRVEAHPFVPCCGGEDSSDSHMQMRPLKRGEKLPFLGNPIRVAKKPRRVGRTFTSTVAVMQKGRTAGYVRLRFTMDGQLVEGATNMGKGPTVLHASPLRCYEHCKSLLEDGNFDGYTLCYALCRGIGGVFGPSKATAGTIFVQ